MPEKMYPPLTRSRVLKGLQEARHLAETYHTDKEPLILTIRGKEYFYTKRYESKAQKDKESKDLKAFAKKWGLLYVIRKVKNRTIDLEGKPVYAIFVHIKK